MRLITENFLFLMATYLEEYGKLWYGKIFEKDILQMIKG